MSSEVTARVAEMVEPVLSASGIELVDIEYLSEGGHMVLRIFIDTESGITMNEIGSVSREISTLLDVENIVDGRYSLEVSSPGLERPLRKPSHFKDAVGKAARIKQ